LGPQSSLDGPAPAIDSFIALVSMNVVEVETVLAFRLFDFNNFFHIGFVDEVCASGLRNSEQR